MISKPYNSYLSDMEFLETGVDGRAIKRWYRVYRFEHKIVMRHMKMERGILKY